VKSQKRKHFWIFLDTIYEKQKAFTPHTYVNDIIHIDVLNQVYAIARLRPKIFS
jgi:hypothetical protein